MANRFTDPRSQFFDSTPAVYSGGLLYFYLTGTTTATDSYSNSTITTPNANPVVLDSAGRLPNDVFLDPSVTYKVVLKTSAGVTVWTADPVVDPAANVTAAFQVYSGNPNGNVSGSAGSVGGTSASSIFDIANAVLYVCTTTGTATTAVWTQVGATLEGGVQMTGDISPTALAADADNYSPTNNTGASVIRQDASANVIITGLAGGADGFLKTIVNISTAYTITLADGAINTTSDAANRFTFGGNNHILYPNQSIDLIYDSASTRWRQKGNQPMLPVPWPGGRLTLTASTPVLTSETIDQTTVYYTPYLHGFVPLYNGTNWYISPFSEMSQTLDDATKSPAAAAVLSNYDLFVWDNAGTLRCTRGPKWTLATTITVTIATPAVVSWSSHGLNEGDPVIFTTTGALPTGITAGTVYYVSRSPAAGTFNISTTVANAAAGTLVATSGTQSGVHTATNATRSRGTGAGTTELERVNGIWMNKIAITNGPAAQRGVYVGTISTDGSGANGELNMMFAPTAAAGGSANRLDVWNMYNRVNVASMCKDSTNSWNYTTDTWRSANNNTANRITFVRGMNEDVMFSYSTGIITNASTVTFRTGIGINATNAYSGYPGVLRGGSSGTTGFSVHGHYAGLPGLGSHFAQWLERSEATGTTTWYGDDGAPLDTQTGMMLTTSM